MSPPIFTPDGSEVTEIVLPDGSTASQVVGPDGSVVFDAGPDIPDSAEVQVNAKQLTGFSDGDNVNPRPDQVAGNDLAGSGTFRPSGVNGNQSVEYESSDGHQA